MAGTKCYVKKKWRNRKWCAPKKKECERPEKKYADARKRKEPKSQFSKKNEGRGICRKGGLTKSEWKWNWKIPY